MLNNLIFNLRTISKFTLVTLLFFGVQLNVVFAQEKGKEDALEEKVIEKKEPGKLVKSDRKADIVKYRRSSLHTMMIDGEKLPNADLIIKTFNEAPVPDKYNDHSISTKLVTFADVDKMSPPAVNSTTEPTQVSALVADDKNREVKVINHYLGLKHFYTDGKRGVNPKPILRDVYQQLMSAKQLRGWEISEVKVVNEGDGQVTEYVGLTSTYGLVAELTQFAHKGKYNLNVSGSEAFLARKIYSEKSIKLIIMV